MPNNRRGFGRATSGSEWRDSNKIGRLVKLPTCNTVYIKQAPADRAEAIQALDELCLRVLIYPHIVLSPKTEDEIALSDLTLTDKLAIITALLEAK